MAECMQCFASFRRSWSLGVMLCDRCLATQLKELEHRKHDDLVPNNMSVLLDGWTTELADDP